MTSVRNRASASAIAAAVALVVGVPSAQAAAINAAGTWVGADGTQSWDVGTNWSTSPDHPSGDAAAVTFNTGAASRSVQVNVGVTVPSITINATSNFSNNIQVGTSGVLTFDAVGAGPATFTTTGTGTANNSISVAMVLTDSLVANVNQVPGNSTSGSLTLGGAMSGPGGFTKNGAGLLTVSTSNKTYLGPTVMNGGRIRLSVAGNTTGTSSYTVNNGAQLTPIASGTFRFGPLATGVLNLNGTGLGAGSHPGDFPGAIRPDTGFDVVIDSNVFLQSDSLVHSQANAGVGSITFPREIGGPGRLTFTAPNSNTSLGTLNLTADNSYSGGTTINGGNLVVSGATADLGSGNVEVKNIIAGANARLTISAGVANAIGDLATLSLEGGGTGGVADQGYAVLGAGINDTIAGLTLGGVVQTLGGTYGSSASSATFQNDEFFSGLGVVTLAIPEPTDLALLGLGAAGLLARRRGSR